MAPEPSPTSASRRPHPVLWLRAHPQGADIVFGVVVAALSLVAHLLIPETAEADIAGPSVGGAVLAVVGCLPIIWRRRYPLAVLLAILPALLVSFGLEQANLVAVAMLIATYTFGSLCGGKKLWLVGGAVWLGLMVWTGIGVVVDKADIESLISNGVIFATSFVIGDNMRRRRERQDELLERAERAERERELLAVQRVQHERTRLARELHDVVAHGVSSMVIQAAAARRQLDKDPENARAALVTIERTGREAMTEMRRVLGVLRDDDTADRAPQPSLDTLRQLVADASDLPITLTADLSAALPPGVEVHVYRIVQESLTNVRRHAGRVDRVDVTVRADAGNVRVEVIDDGRGASSLATVDGFGLRGMRERVAMYAGELDAGPHRGGGWQVRARIPLPGGAR